MASKKKQEEIEKQINIKEEFADKVYKKMRADRYGLTFCCPNDLEKINVKNYMCNWQDIGYEVMPEKFDKNYTRNPIANYCAPPGTFNAVTGLCDAEAELELVGVTEFTTADSIPNGTPTSLVPANSSRYGRDCPIIFESINLDGTGTNPFMIPLDDDNDPDNSWWKYYDATDPSGEFFNPLNPNVTNVNFCNALAKRPSGGWPSSVTYEWAVNVTPTATTTYHVAICADHKFGLSTTTSGVTTDLIGMNTFSASNITQSIGQADPDWDPDGSGSYTWQGLIDEEVGNVGIACHSASIYYYDQTIDPFTGVGNNNRVTAARWFIYPITLDAGCHRINIKGFNKDFEGMLAAVVWQNSKAEILAAESRSALTEVFASDLQPSLYQNINNSEPWTCNVGVLTTTSPFSADCPGCRQETSTLVQQCPEGYTYNNSTQRCEGIFPICDTETLVFEVVNQNGEVMPDYEITFDGGTYITNELGYLEIVVQNASVNTDHNLNLCHCITTGGGCAIQNIKITVTDSNAIVCTPVDKLCPCKAPALITTKTGPVLTNPASIILTFQDFNLNNSSNTIESYIFEYRVYTAAGDGGWQTITITKPASVTTFNVNLSLSAGSTYEYRIKTKCTETESGYSGIYSITIPDTFGEDLIGWWDFTDQSTVFQDLAGTVPAETGQYLRRVNNKSTSTKKLGNFLRSIETLGWTNVYPNFPRYEINSTINQSYADMSTGIPFNQTIPFIGASDAGFGGVNDGVSFSTLNNFNNKDFTIINVILNDANTLGNSNSVQFVFNLNGERNTGTGYTGVHYSVDGTSMAPGNKFTRASIFENVSQTTPGIIIPFINAGMELTVLRSTSDSDNNVLGRNEWDVNNATTYNQVNNFNLPDAETLDITGSTVGANSPGFSLGGFRFGSNVTGPWRGQFYESLIFNKALSDADLNAVVSYLKTKYGVI